MMRNSGPSCGAHGNSRGQILSSDLIISLSLFLGAIMIFFIAWSSMSYAYWESRADLDMQSALLPISDALVLTSGSPTDWEISSPTSASSLGIAIGKNEISGEKAAALQSFFSSNYSEAKVRLGAGRFEAYVEVRSQGGEVLYSFGRTANFTDRQIVPVSAERLAIMNGQLVDVKVTLWRVRGGSI